jgi:hypothetical protein
MLFSRKKSPDELLVSRKETGARRDRNGSWWSVRPERLSAKRSKAAKRLGQVSWLKEVLNQPSHHSGATARDSHPLPYSPHLMGHPDAFK